KPDYLVFKINTYGGELQSAFEIVDLLMGISQCSTYAYVEQKAISAGALIALANNRLAMGAGTTIGDCAPITQSQDGIVMLGEKIQSPLRAKFRTMAEKNGYPSLLAESMVTSDIGVVVAETASDETASPGKKAGTKVYFTAKQWEGLGEKEKARYRNHKTVVAEGQLLTMTDREAQEHGFSQGSFASLEEFLESKGWERAGDIGTTWSEDLVRMIGKFAPVLMMLGFGALYLEFKTPGLSVFGLIGAICLAIVFGSKYAVGLANHTELLLLVAGLVLFMMEMYLFPGTLIAGALGIALMVVALTLSLQTFTLPDPEMPWELKSLVDNLFMVLGTAALGLIFPLLLARYVLPRLPSGLKVISDATMEGARADSPESARLAPGASGIAKTSLRPYGKAVFADQTFEVSSRGEFIDAGSPVEVSRIEGNTILVRRKESAA